MMDAGIYLPVLSLPFLCNWGFLKVHYKQNR
jgi:hypothetical protein